MQLHTRIPRLPRVSYVLYRNRNTLAAVVHTCQTCLHQRWGEKNRFNCLTVYNNSHQFRWYLKKNQSWVAVISSVLDGTASTCARSVSFLYIKISHLDWSVYLHAFTTSHTASVASLTETQSQKTTRDSRERNTTLHHRHRVQIWLCLTQTPNTSNSRPRQFIQIGVPCCYVTPSSPVHPHKDTIKHSP